MKILMFGWEFPPHISGGLGTACFGLTKGLARHDVEMIFMRFVSYYIERYYIIKTAIEEKVFLI